MASPSQGQEPTLQLRPTLLPWLSCPCLPFSLPFPMGGALPPLARWGCGGTVREAVSLQPAHPLANITCSEVALCVGGHAAKALSECYVDRFGHPHIYKEQQARVLIRQSGDEPGRRNPCT
jgi:hypothetical protein